MSLIISIKRAINSVFSKSQERRQKNYKKQEAAEEKPKASQGARKPRTYKKDFAKAADKPRVQTQGKEKPKAEGRPQTSERPRPSGRNQNRPRSQEKPRFQARQKEAEKPEAEIKEKVVEIWDPKTFQVDALEGKKRFQDFNIPEEVMHAIYDNGFQYCTPIQAEILGETLKGRDAMGRAQTGTGKTAAFLVAVINKLITTPPQVMPRHTGTPRALVIAPTRELVMQITKEAIEMAKYTDLAIIPIFGGMDYQKQKASLDGKIIDIAVATPGRLIDFHKQRDIHLSKAEVLVIDEADRMLDMGFIPDVRNIVRFIPKDRRQTMIFSATLTPEVERLASNWMTDPAIVEIEPNKVVVDSIKQVTYMITNDQKYPVLYNTIQKGDLQCVMIFCNRKDETQRLWQRLSGNGISCEMLTGDVPQKKRMKTLEDFKEGKIRILVATDVAGRGIHVDGVSHVINYNLPEDPEDYVHRIGRTGRAGADGISISFADEDDSFQIPAIEEYIGTKLDISYPADELLVVPPKAHPVAKPERAKQYSTQNKRRPARRRPPRKIEP